LPTAPNAVPQPKGRIEICLDEKGTLKKKKTKKKIRLGVVYKGDSWFVGSGRGFRPAVREAGAPPAAGTLAARQDSRGRPGRSDYKTDRENSPTRGFSGGAGNK